MPRRLTDGTSLVGKTFGKWLVVEAGHRLPSSKQRSAVKVKCKCGTEKLVSITKLIRGESTGCRDCCYSRRTHGMSRTPEYKTWHGMIRRCYDKFHPSYHNYGGRGVTVCDRWNPAAGGSFENFYADLGPRPNSLHQLDKDIFDGNLVYSPSTVKWVHRSENAKRKRTSIWVEWKGEKIRLVDLADKTGIPASLLRCRIRRRGIPVERAVAMG